MPNDPNEFQFLPTDLATWVSLDKLNEVVGVDFNHMTLMAMVSKRVGSPGADGVSSRIGRVVGISLFFSLGQLTSSPP